MRSSFIQGGRRRIEDKSGFCNPALAIPIFIPTRSGGSTPFPDPTNRSSTPSPTLSAPLQPADSD
jgi:hypothetical protein